MLRSIPRPNSPTRRTQIGRSMSSVLRSGPGEACVKMEECLGAEEVCMAWTEYSIPRHHKQPHSGGYVSETNNRHLMSVSSRLPSVQSRLFCLDCCVSSVVSRLFFCSVCSGERLTILPFGALLPTEVSLTGPNVDEGVETPNWMKLLSGRSRELLISDHRWHFSVSHASEDTFVPALVNMVMEVVMVMLVLVLALIPMLVLIPMLMMMASYRTFQPHVV
ncbi:hypothetical protein BJ875DRAFT_204203 [Amylocarpus encephaloides]|uniref:Uncharacterized protein n=1 Tax=Amylocarpus encephaloides TaxID=45428 RepID=A0A9P7YNA7_9HELO|nr:hypothetical protein BJ875DRAFT_204203 [Amylocarpus encephaloides]